MLNKLFPMLFPMQLLLVFLLWPALPAWSMETDDTDIDLFAEVFEAKSESPHPTALTPRPTSKIAENVTVITSEEIAKLNAHTLNEVLQTVTGFQSDKAGRTPGMFEFITLQGANSKYILVQVDGVSQNEQGENMADLGTMTVQQIERVEIIKGGSSAAWGQALGGVINIVTKAPDPDSAFSGKIFSTMGDKFTTDQRVEFSGTVNRFGYYLTGGLLHSDGLLGNNGINQNNIFGKVVYNLPVKGHVTFTVDDNNSRRGIEEVPPKTDAKSAVIIDDWRDNYDRKQLSSLLSFTYPLTSRLNLELDGHYSFLKTDSRQGQMTTPELTQQYLLNETNWGARSKLIWGDNHLNLTSGVEFEHNQINLSETVVMLPSGQIRKNFDRSGIFSNGSLSVGALTILPGLRYDRVDTDHNEMSYTLGATYCLSGKSVLRGYFARGYSRTLAVLNNTSPQKGWTAQLGVETGDIPYLWLKGTLFYNNSWNMLDQSGAPSTSAQIRQGLEIEVRTIPLYDFSLSIGYTLTDLRDKGTRTRIEGIPGDLLKLSVRYDKPSWGLHCILNGNYVWWNNPAELRPEDRNFLWNLHLTQKLLPSGELSPELFMTVHNLFNSAQYADYHYVNAGRWLEGGVRFHF